MAWVVMRAAMGKLATWIASAVAGAVACTPFRQVKLKLVRRANFKVMLQL